MHESDEAPPDQGVPLEPDAVDRAHAAELAVLLFLCPGLTTQQLEALTDGTARSEDKDPAPVADEDPARALDRASEDS